MSASFKMWRFHEEHGMQNMSATRKGEDGKVPARISILFARAAPTAVIFRRGPSGWFQVTRWNTATDEFQTGQWFHGRIYEKRCDLSPDGELLVYFVRKITGRTMKDKEYTYAWTAVSKPPYLTALALWPKGDCWAGGGAFLDDTHLELNHGSNRAAAHPNHKPDGLHVTLRNFVRGEDDPLYSERLERDGWKLQRDWILEYHGPSDYFKTHTAELRVKTLIDRGLSIHMRRSMTRLHYSEEFDVLAADLLGVPIVSASWVDFDQRGRLIIARGGKVSVGDAVKGEVAETVLVDLNGHAPQEIVSPDWARQWGSKRERLFR